MITVSELLQTRPEAVKVRVCGKVQGVGYRGWLRDEAKAKGLAGWVRNVADGSVQAMLAGPAAALEEVLRAMEIGPSRATVDFIRARPFKPTTRNKGFRVRKSLGVASNGASGSKADKAFAGVCRQLLKTNNNNPLSTTPEGQYFWKHGFLANKIQLYDISRHGLSDYLSDIQRLMAWMINGPARWLLNDKLAFELAFRNILEVPTTVLSTEEGYVSCAYEDGVIPPGEFFAKPVGSGGGSGVFAVSFDGRTVRFQGREASWKEFIDHLRSREKSYLLCRKVEQHGKLAAMYSGSTNTIRVLMLRHPQTSEPIVAAAVLRVGSDSSSGLDNFSRGGLSFGIDIESGTIGLGFTKRYGRNRPYERHPNAGSRTSGEQIPYWPEVLSRLKAAFRESALRYVGWDVIVSEEGPVVLEGNNCSDVNLLQIHGPLLSDPEVKAFYSYHHILKWTGPPA